MIPNKGQLGVMAARIIVGVSVGIASLGAFMQSAFGEEMTSQTEEPLRCVAFSPYVDGYNPQDGPHPSRRLIGELLDSIPRRFRCIMTYGTLNGLDATFPEAKKRGLKVIAIIWLDQNQSTNSRSITAGIRAARRYPGTIIRLSCGSEMRARNGNARERCARLAA